MIAGHYIGNEAASYSGTTGVDISTANPKMKLEFGVAILQQ